MSEINEHILSLRGKASIPKALLLSHDYRLELDGSIVKISETDNDDGTKNITYIFQPYTCEVVNERGERMKGKDKSKLSQKLRQLNFVVEQEANDGRDYEWFMKNLFNHFTDIRNYLIEHE